MRALLVLANSLVELGRLQIQYLNASIFSERWFLFLCTTAGFLVAVVPNTLDQRVLRWYFRITACFACVLFMIYWIWFPIASRDHLQPTSGSLATSTAGLLGFCSGLGSSTATTHPSIWQKRPTRQVRSLQKACGQAHCPRGYYPYQRSSSSYFCIRNFDAIVNGTYANNFVELCLQALGPKGATTVLILCWLDSTCGTIICILSAQRVLPQAFHK